MKKVLILVFTIGLFFWSFKNEPDSILNDATYMQHLRNTYGSGDVTKWEAPHIDSSQVANFKDIGPLEGINFPANNPYTKAKKELGKMLFFDPRLSQSKQIACSSCHDPDLAWSDGRTTSYGHNRQRGKRNSPTLLNIAYYNTYFWDGRAQTLEEQISFPLQDPLEMHSSPSIAVKNIKKIKGYKPLFKEAFGSSEITYERIVQAIATYERTIVSPPTRFDRFVKGEKVKFSDEELLGLHLFRTKARCINCHNTPLFSNSDFHNVGLSYYGRPFEDLGRYVITNKYTDVGKFRTPTLREVSRTAPYMHNGLLPDLAGVLQMYNVGMPRLKPRAYEVNDPLFPTTDVLLKPLNLTQEELNALEAFIKTLSTPAVLRERVPNLPN